MVGACREGEEPSTWTADPLEPAARPLMLCDLCETVRVDHAPDSDQVPHSVTVHVPIPPFNEELSRQASGLVPDMDPCLLRLSVRRLQCFCRPPTDRRDMDALAQSVCEAFCANARHDINDMLVSALLVQASNGRIPCFARRADQTVDGACLSGALTALCKSPHLQFPLDFVCALPSSRLACLLPASAGRLAICEPGGKTRINVSGLDFVSYDPSPRDSDASWHHHQPAFVMPRRGSLGLALSDIAVRAEQDGSMLRFSGSYITGSEILRPGGIVCMPHGDAQ